MLFIARRYLISAKSHSVVNIIAWVSIISLLLPVAAVIILLSIFNGFGVMLSDMESNLESDITLRLREGKFFEMGDIDTASIQEIEGVQNLSFVSEQTLLLKHQEQSVVMTLRGVDEGYLSTVPIEQSVEIGEFEVENKGIVLGYSMVARLGIRSLQDTYIDIYALKTGRLQSIIPTGSYNSDKAILSGILHLDQENEDRYAFVSQEFVNDLIGRNGAASQLSISIDGGSDIERIRHDIHSVVGDRYNVLSRSELNPTMHQIIHYEKMGVLLICTFVIILASFSLLGALTMLIIEKSGDFVTLRSIGFTRGGIARIFKFEGLLISGVAILSGVILGIAVTLAQQYWGFIKLPSSSMVTTAYPIKLQLSDVVGVVMIASVISMVITHLVVKRVLSRRLNTSI